MLLLAASTLSCSQPSFSCDWVQALSAHHQLGCHGRHVTESCILNRSSQLSCTRKHASAALPVHQHFRSMTVHAQATYNIVYDLTPPVAGILTSPLASGVSVPSTVSTKQGCQYKDV
jgi:hypothetical protein